MPSKFLFLAAVLAGFFFGSMSFSFQMGQRWKVPSLHIGFVLSLLDCLFFLGLLLFQPAPAAAETGAGHGAAWVWIAAIAAGATQVLTLALVDPAQRLGPAAPIFCMMNLAFLPVSLYAIALLGETMSPTQWGGLGLAVLCVISTGMMHSVPRGSHAAPAPASRRMAYAGILAVILVVNSIYTLAMKQLDAMPAGATSLLQTHRNLFPMLVYAVIALGTAPSILRSLSGFNPARAIPLGAIAGAGSVGGFICLSRAISIPGGIGVGISTTASLLTIALIAAFIFREQRTPAWYATIILAIAGVLLFAV